MTDHIPTIDDLSLFDDLLQKVRIAKDACIDEVRVVDLIDMENHILQVIEEISMDLEQLVKEVSKIFQDYPKAKVVFNINDLVKNPLFVQSIYPEINVETGETWIVVSNMASKGEK